MCCWNNVLTDELIMKCEKWKNESADAPGSHELPQALAAERLFKKQVKQCFH